MVGSQRIIIVDDEPDILNLVGSYLETWNFDVDGFTDPNEALEYFKRNPSLFSLVLTDIRMPGTSGVVLAKNILEIKPEMKIMLMTAYEMPSSLKMDDGLPLVKYEDILKKPFRLADICHGIKRQLQIAY